MVVFVHSQWWSLYTHNGGLCVLFCDIYRVDVHNKTNTVYFDLDIYLLRLYTIYIVQKF